MSLLSRHPDEVICPDCGFHNRPSFRACHGCAAPLRPDKKGILKAIKRALSSLGWLVFGWVELVAQWALHSIAAIAVFLAISTCITRLAPTRKDPVDAVEPTEMVTAASKLIRTAELALKEFVVPIEPAAIATAVDTSTLPMSDGRITPTYHAVYKPPVSLSARSGTDISPPIPTGSISASGLVPPQVIVTQPARTEVITYRVQRGDTVFAVAREFGLTPHTIYWANLETLADNPSRLSVGMTLKILPVNGVYHIVSTGETSADLAEKYGVKPKALYNEWNDLQEGQSLDAGTALVIPGGSGGAVPWRLSETHVGGRTDGENLAAPGFCGGTHSGVPGRGTFYWPTDERQISGWYFHDERNPTHIGLDIGLETGDPVYAADGGVISYAGWWVHGGYGNIVVVDHLNGWETWYAHFSEVKAVCGQEVSAGDVIGLGGSTGYSSGPHLHFEMRLGGVPQNPLNYLPSLD